jgi:hypothetical protein
VDFTGFLDELEEGEIVEGLEFGEGHGVNAEKLKS